MFFNVIYWIILRAFDSSTSRTRSSQKTSSLAAESV